MRHILLCIVFTFAASVGIANAAQLSVAQPGGPGTPAQAPTPAAPKPGEIVVHIDLRENVYAAGAWGSGDSVGGNKQQPFGLIGFPRLYAGWDGLAANGLKYGMFYEIRIVGAANFAGSSSANPGISASSTGGALFFRRDYGYIGTDKAGTLRLGQIDGPLSLLIVGTFDDFATGLFNGDLAPAGVGAQGFSGVVPTWPFPDFIGNEYTSAKLVYLSPSFHGVDFGVSYEPTSANLVDSSSCIFSATGPTGCVFQSSSSNGGDLQRRRNTIEAGVRYRGTFDGVSVAASLATMQGGRINPTGGATTSTPGGPAISKFDNISVYDGGFALTYAGVTVGGNVVWGSYNGQLAPKPDGGANSVAWIGGIEYTFGPMIVGASYFRWKYQGALGLTTQRTDQGFGAGLTYNLAPGLSLLAEYLYGQRHQGGYNFIANSAAPGIGSAFNNVQTQIIGTGLQFRW